MKELDENSDRLQKNDKVIEEEFLALLYKVPNIISEETPVGKDDKDNKIIRKWGTVPKFNFEPKDHIHIGEKLGLIDITKAAEISGSRFSYLKNEAALMEFALVSYGLAVLTSEKILKKIAAKIKKNYSSKPFIAITPPVIIRPEIFKKMARLSEEDREQRYYLAKDDLYLVGSAEHTLGPLHLNETLEESDLPLRYVGFSTCFRREAGSYGKYAKGIFRVHQFDKLEAESFALMENGESEQDFLVAIQEYLMQSLGIPYQVAAVCSGDMGKPDYRQIDIESWLPSQNRYLETHSADLMTDYQSRRLNTKVIKTGGLKEFAAMNDATVFAIGRTIIAILENYQQKDGSVKIPAVLQKYLGGRKLIKPKKPF